MAFTILIISIHADPSMPPGVGEWGGTHTYMKELLIELSSIDCNVIFITRRGYSDQPLFEQINDSCCIHRIDLGTFGYFDKRSLFDLHDATVEKIDHLWTTFSEKPDIIHSVYWNSGHATVKLSQKYNVPFVHSVISNGRGRNARGADNTAKNRIHTEQMVYDSASQIICVAESEKQEIISFYHIAEEKIIVAGQFVHPTFLYPAHDALGGARASSLFNSPMNQYFTPNVMVQNNESDGKLPLWWSKKSFIFVGRLSVDKGLDYIISAWCSLYAKYGEKCPNLWIVGGSPEEIANFRSIIISSGHSPLLEEAEHHMKLIWWGYLDEAGISALYLKSAVLITHSKYEPGGRVAIEAMSEGLPVIATPNGFALDAILDWRNGFLVEYQNINALITRMEHFITQPFLSASMGLAAKRSAANIRLKWNFLHSHLRAYSNAMHQASAKNNQENKDILPEYDYFSKRYFISYPIFNAMIDQSVIINELHNWEITNLVKLEEKTFESDGSSFIIAISTDKENYIAKIPFTRLRLKPMYDEDCAELVTPSQHRYNREIFAGTLSFAAPIFKKSEKYHIILRKTYAHYIFRSPKQYLQDSLKIILDMYNYDMAQFRTVFNLMNKMFEESASLAEIKKEYLKIGKMNYNLAYDTIFSIRYEWRWLKEKIRSIRNSELVCYLNNYIPTVDSVITEYIASEKDMPVVLVNGDLIPDNIVEEEGKVYSLDHDCLHVAWMGRDYANSIICSARENTDSTLWIQLIQDTLDVTRTHHHIPSKLLISWIIALICHDLIMLDRLIVNIPAYRYLQLKVLQEILLQPL
ncbi:D-inositol 3-phosphate glycosyltransferase [compost metagenome]